MRFMLLFTFLTMKGLVTYHLAVACEDHLESLISLRSGSMGAIQPRLDHYGLTYIRI